MSAEKSQLTDVEAELWRMESRVRASGAIDAAKVLELAAIIVGMSGRQAVALNAAQDMLTKIEAGSCDHPGYEAGTWLKIYGEQRMEGLNPPKIKMNTDEIIEENQHLKDQLAAMSKTYANDMQRLSDMIDKRQTALRYISEIIEEKAHELKDLELGSTAYKSVRRWASEFLNAKDDKFPRNES